MSIINDVISIIYSVLNIDQALYPLNKDSLLLGNIPEFDSTAVIAILTAIEENFDIIIEDDEITAEVFETVGTLVDYLEGKI